MFSNARYFSVFSSKVIVSIVYFLSLNYYGKVSNSICKMDIFQLGIYLIAKSKTKKSYVKLLKTHMIFDLFILHKFNLPLLISTYETKLRY